MLFPDIAEFAHCVCGVVHAGSRLNTNSVVLGSFRELRGTVFVLQFGKTRNNATAISEDRQGETGVSGHT